MCGIVAAIAKHDVTQILLDGLARLEYRGYDSAGIAILNAEQNLQRHRTVGKVKELAKHFQTDPLKGNIGIAHTRWATHGKPSENNAHPHFSHEKIAVVHNGIVENYLQLKKQLEQKGYQFQTETDTEIIVHQIYDFIQQGENFFNAVKLATEKMQGAFAITVMFVEDPNTLIAVRKGAPVVIGLSKQGQFVASDPLALLSLTQNFIFLEDNEIAEIKVDDIKLFNYLGEKIYREQQHINIKTGDSDKGDYQHYMLKEIMEQPSVVKSALQGRTSDKAVLDHIFGPDAEVILQKTQAIQIVACGTSYHAGSIARYWLEELAGIPCSVEVASELRYRKKVVAPNTLFVTISQSGETADTLAAAKQAKKLGYLAHLTICNVPQSSLVRESDLVLMTQAGVEIGVASTKAFTTQLIALLLLTLVLQRKVSEPVDESYFVEQLQKLPEYIQQVLDQDAIIKQLATQIIDKQHALFLGRGSHFPLALEGALKLKEISYIHAEAYPAGELKHGPLALVDQNMPVIATMPKDDLSEKLSSNLQEVRARGGELFIFADERLAMKSEEYVHVIAMPAIDRILSPIVYVVALQLLAYHAAVLKGTDVDQPRNLAKSVTVE